LTEDPVAQANAFENEYTPEKIAELKKKIPCQ